jgi:hypothetical protein
VRSLLEKHLNKNCKTAQQRLAFGHRQADPGDGGTGAQWSGGGLFALTSSTPPSAMSSPSA